MTLSSKLLWEFNVVIDILEELIEKDIDAALISLDIICQKLVSLGLGLEPKERWLPVIGYESHYEVSNFGRVASLKHRWGQRNQPLILKASPMGTGYPRVTLVKDSKQEYRLVHHLVLEAFVGPRPKGCEAEHYDGIRTNASLHNLRWATPKENASDKTRHGTHRNKFTGAMEKVDGV